MLHGRIGPADGVDDSRKLQELRGDARLSRRARRSLAKASVVFAALAAALVPVAATATMTVPGAFEVSETGAAVYTVPITVPPGTAGLQPSLSLLYTSSGGEGLFGRGWTLTGLPAILRCGSVTAQDKPQGSVTYASADRFCLDDARLVAVSGTYGADGTEYRTEHEGFSKIVSRGQADPANAAAGPAWFEIWTKAGQRMEFGNTADSRIEAQGRAAVRVWAVNKVEDSKGNYFTAHYAENNAAGEYNPTRIEYTGNTAANVAPYAKVEFIYDMNRPDPLLFYYSGGSGLFTRKRLTAIKTSVGPSLAAASLVQEYRITYPAGTPSLVSAIELCTAEGICLPATRFTYTAGGTGAFNPVHTALPANYGAPPFAYATIRGDFNGDGRTDYLLAAGAQQHVFLSAGDGTFTPTVSTYPNAWNFGTAPNYLPVTGDFNADGRTDYLFVGETHEYVFLAKADGSFDPVVNTQPNNWNFGNNPVPYLRVVGDFNGDGRGDYMLVAGTKQYVFTSKDDGQPETKGKFDARSNTLTTANFAPVSEYTVLEGDYNGDGRTDFIASRGNTYHVYLSKGDGTFEERPPTLYPNSWTFGVPVRYTPVAGDFNGDGLSDFLWTGETSLYRFISKGDGTFTSQRVVFANGLNIGFREHEAIPGDFDGDGRTDVALTKGNALYLALATSDGAFDTTRSYSYPASLPNGGNFGSPLQYAAVAGDFDGDGKSDYALVGGASGYAFLAGGDVPRRLASVASGLGAAITITHRPLTYVPPAPEPPLYVKDSGAFAALSPYIDAQGPFFVVARVETSNGRAGVHRATYRYRGAKLAAAGRSFLGFREMTVRDEQSAIEQTTIFRLDSPFTGLAWKQTKTLGTVELNRTEKSYAATDLGNGRSFLHLTHSVESSKELDGAAMPWVATQYQYDGFGNPTQVKVTTYDPATGQSFVKTTHNEYENVTTALNGVPRWHLGRLKKSNVTSQTDAGVQVAPQLANTVDITLAQTAANFVLDEEMARRAGWYPGLGVKVTVKAGVTVGSNATAQPAFDVAAFPAGTPITVVNNGSIIGRGGTAGSGGIDNGPPDIWSKYIAGNPGQPGGPAFRTTVPVTVQNVGMIAGGGGGGGGGVSFYFCYDCNGGQYAEYYGGGGGGGGAGFGQGGNGGTTSISGYWAYWLGTAGSGGTATAGGAGGPGGNNTQVGGGGYAGDGGVGGAPGQAGAAGTQFRWVYPDGAVYPQGTPGPGGAPGAAVIGNAYITWTTTGDRRGALQ